ncbi:MAG: hypothetical protein ACTSRE_07265 [Promethearchaeota archaeon]
MVEDIKDIHKTTTIISTQVTFSIPPKRWISTYSLKYPQLEFEILSLLSISEEQGNCLFRIKGNKLLSFYNEFSREYDSTKFQLAKKDKDEIMFSTVFASPWVIWSMISPQVIILYPIKIQNGKITIEIIAPVKKIEEIFRKPIWKKLNLKFKVAKKYCGAPTLNDHQKFMLDKAMEYGLFDIPRPNSLTKAVELLEQSGVKMSVSALSENIRRISKKLAECYVNCRDTDEVKLDFLVEINKKEKR